MGPFVDPLGPFVDPFGTCVDPLGPFGFTFLNTQTFLWDGCNGMGWKYLRNTLMSSVPNLI